MDEYKRKGQSKSLGWGAPASCHDPHKKDTHERQCPSSIEETCRKEVKITGWL